MIGLVQNNGFGLERFRKPMKISKEYPMCTFSLTGKQTHQQGKIRQKAE
jgi:hypothetical protein